MTQKNSFRSFLVTLIIGCIFMGACTVGLPSMATTNPTATQIVEQFTGTPNLPAPTPTVGYFPEEHLTLPSGLSIDEYALQSRPAGEPLVFVPVLGSQDAILAKHATERQAWLSNTDTVLLNGEKLIAKQIQSSSEIYASLSIELILNSKTIYSTPAGVVSPKSGMMGLWSYGNGKHWALEIADLEVTPTTVKILTGKIIQDGVATNQKINAQETFGFQVFNDKPFYFFKRDDHISISYDGQETLLNYTYVPHYKCCSAEEGLGLQQHPSMVTFFARKQGTWYYVEIGGFDQKK